MSRTRALLATVGCALALAGCGGLAAPTPQPTQPSVNPTVLAKITIDLGPIGNDGLYGPADGKRALDYEFCIPRTDAAKAEVGKIDPTAQFQTSRGRIGCTSEQYLVLGNTHQDNWRLVLYQLASLPYVARIDQAHFE